MSENEIETSENTNDILDLEFQFNEKLEELKWKSEILDDNKKEISTLYQQTGELRLLLENERRKINELKRQLHSTNEINHLLEKENVNHRNERHQLQINYNLLQKERDFLLNEIRNLKSDNIHLNSVVQEFKNMEVINSAKSKHQEQKFNQMKNEITQNLSSLNSNMSKLGKEQDYLRKSVEEVICLNKRLQTAALAMHTFYKKQENQIQKLQRKLVSTTCIKPATNRSVLVNRSSQSRSQINPQLLSELKLQEEDWEKQLSNVLHEIEFEQREAGALNPM